MRRRRVRKGEWLALSFTPDYLSWHHHLWQPSESGWGQISFPASVGFIIQGYSYLCSSNTDRRQPFDCQHREARSSAMDSYSPSCALHAYAGSRGEFPRLAPRLERSGGITHSETAVVPASLCHIGSRSTALPPFAAASGGEETTPLARGDRHCQGYSPWPGSKSSGIPGACWPIKDETDLGIVLTVCCPAGQSRMSSNTLCGYPLPILNPVGYAASLPRHGM